MEPMCYGDDAVPPPHDRAGTVGGEEDLVLTSADGTRFSAHLARAGTPAGTGMLVFPDVRGLHSYYCALTRRFAEAGIDALAFDYYGRGAGLADGRDEGFDYKPFREKLTYEQVDADAAAAAEQLRAATGVERLFTVGFCMGGGFAWGQSGSLAAVSGAVGFYGNPERARQLKSQLKAPLLLLVAGADFRPPEEIEKFASELTEAGVPNRVVVYDGAPHSFFDRTYEAWQDACADAWEQVLRFMDTPPV